MRLFFKRKARNPCPHPRPLKGGHGANMETPFSPLGVRGTGGQVQYLCVKKHPKNWTLAIWGNNGKDLGEV